MARRPKPWFRNETGWWMVTLGGKQHKLDGVPLAIEYRGAVNPLSYCEKYGGSLIALNSVSRNSNGADITFENGKEKAKSTSMLAGELLFLNLPSLDITERVDLPADRATFLDLGARDSMLTAWPATQKRVRQIEETDVHGDRFSCTESARNACGKRHD